MSGARDGGPVDAERCEECAAPVSSSMRYCPSCGARQVRSTDQRARRHRRSTLGSRTRSAGSRTSRSTSARSPESGRESASRHVSAVDRRTLERRIANELEEGWELEHDFGDHAVLVRRSFGPTGTHLLVALITVWWTMGLGNALYAAYQYFGNAERKVVRPDRTARVESSDPSGSSSERATSADRSSPAKLIFTVGLLWLFGLALLLEGSLLVSGFGVLLFVVGAAMIPSVRRRVRDRDPITINGRAKSVEERRVASPDRPCAVCHRSIDEGVERTYREVLTLFGVSLVTTERGENYYCDHCAGLDRGSSPRNRGHVDGIGAELDEPVSDEKLPEGSTDSTGESGTETDAVGEPEFSAE
ncbi:zinc ribbon domain-containing protein [Natrialbaceae archaeon GCM10025810]|uniref:zinc ribbon domain-containing protein n=1 Tax=Halovalidus salilacus TaxID=3075124 RepID=UPI003615D0DE